MKIKIILRAKGQQQRLTTEQCFRCRRYNRGGVWTPEQLKQRWEMSCEPAGTQACEFRVDVEREHSDIKNNKTTALMHQPSLRSWYQNRVILCFLSVSQDQCTAGARLALVYTRSPYLQCVTLTVCTMSALGPAALNVLEGDGFPARRNGRPRNMLLALCASLIRLHPVSTMQNAVGVRWWCEERGVAGQTVVANRKEILPPFFIFTWCLLCTRLTSSGKWRDKDSSRWEAFFWMRGGMYLKTGKKRPSHQLMGWMRGNFHIWTLFFFFFTFLSHICRFQARLSILLQSRQKRKRMNYRSVYIPASRVVREKRKK